VSQMRLGRIGPANTGRRERNLMRQVTKTIVDAFFARRSRKCGNTRTDGQTFYLHGNAIAKWEDGDIYITLAGWNTVTTRERLNGIGRDVRGGFSIHQHRGVPRLSLARYGCHGEFCGWEDSVEMPTDEWIDPIHYVCFYGRDI
jgi:hypothetical protein